MFYPFLSASHSSSRPFSETVIFFLSNECIMRQHEASRVYRILFQGIIEERQLIFKICIGKKQQHENHE